MNKIGKLDTECKGTFLEEEEENGEVCVCVCVCVCVHVCVYEIKEQQSYLPYLEVSEYILILKYKERKKKSP